MIDSRHPPPCGQTVVCGFNYCIRVNCLARGVPPINTRSGRLCRQLLTMQTQSAHSGGGGVGISRKTARPQCCQKTLENIFRGWASPARPQECQETLVYIFRGVDIPRKTAILLENYWVSLVGGVSENKPYSEKCPRTYKTSNKSKGQ